jgi:hypothetical protein
MERTRPNPLERVLAQRARRHEAEVIIGQHHDHDSDPTHPSQQQQPIPIVQPAVVPQPQPHLVQPLATHQQVPAHHRSAKFHNTTQQNDGSDDPVDEAGDDGGESEDDLDSKKDLQEEAEEQARRRKAEKEELARKLKKGKAKSHSNLTRRPSLTVVITNIPGNATSSHNIESSSSSSRKRVGFFFYFSFIRLGVLTFKFF